MDKMFKDYAYRVIPNKRSYVAVYLVHGVCLLEGLELYFKASGS